MERRLNILVVYALAVPRPRATIVDQLYAFKRHSSHRYLYLNLALQRWVPRSLRAVPFDAIVFHTTFLAQRWSPSDFEKLCRRAAPLRDLGALRVAIPQDEFLQSDVLCDFIERFRISHVFSAASESEWGKIYARVDRERVGFTTVLTGYLDADSVRRMERIAAETPERSTDIAYRAWEAAPWLGRHGMLKTRIAEAFRDAGARRGLRVDISTREQDARLGEDWYRFLASAKYTIGVEGGASILDRDGSVKRATEAYLERRPGASFEEVEAHCFPGRDGELSLFAISPRHLEACATRTCQILVEGSYNGVLRPGEHYIELKKDLSNLQDVLSAVERDDQRERITAAAWRDVVASRRCDAASFVETVERALLSQQPTDRPAAAPGRLRTALAHALATALDRLGWIAMPLTGTALARLMARRGAASG